MFLSLCVPVYYPPPFGEKSLGIDTSGGPFPSCGTGTRFLGFPWLIVCHRPVTMVLPVYLSLFPLSSPPRYFSSACFGSARSSSSRAIDGRLVPYFHNFFFLNFLLSYYQEGNENFLFSRAPTYSRPPLFFFRIALYPHCP